MADEPHDVRMMLKEGMKKLERADKEYSTIRSYSKVETKKRPGYGYNKKDRLLSCMIVKDLKN
jgi:hypothetical protein